MRTAYVRTSTGGQDGKGQKESINEYCAKEGLKVDKWEYEQASSRTPRNRRKITEIIESMKAGDEIITTEITRLGRSSVSELYTIIEQLREKGGSLRIINNELHITAGSMDIRTEAILNALSIAGRIERDMISERTKNALQARKAQGVKLGRPAGNSKLDERKEEIIGYLKKGINLTAISKLVECTTATLYTWLKNNNIDRRKIQK